MPRLVVTALLVLYTLPLNKFDSLPLSLPPCLPLTNAHRWELRATGALRRPSESNQLVTYAVAVHQGDVLRRIMTTIDWT
jgi:hypothetical protein